MSVASWASDAGTQYFIFHDGRHRCYIEWSSAHNCMASDEA